MFDKQAQRERARLLSESLMAQGHKPPVNPIPLKNFGPKDMLGRHFEIGQRVVRAARYGDSHGVKICTVTGISSQGEVFCDSVSRPLGRPDLALILTKWV